MATNKKSAHPIEEISKCMKVISLAVMGLLIVRARDAGQQLPGDDLFDEREIPEHDKRRGEEWWRKREDQYTKLLLSIRPQIPAISRRLVLPDEEAVSLYVRCDQLWRELWKKWLSELRAGRVDDETIDYLKSLADRAEDLGADLSCISWR